MFNHAIVFVPGALGGEDLWIDATAEYARVGTLPQQDANRLALVIRDGTRSLVRTPALRSADNRQVETREFFLVRIRPCTRHRNHRDPRHHRRRIPHAGTPARTPRRASTTSRRTSRDTYRAKELVNYEHTAQRRFLEALFDEHRDERCAGGIHGPRDRGGRRECRQHHVATAGILRRAHGRQPMAMEVAMCAPRTWCSNPS